MKILVLNHFFDQDIAAIKEANFLNKHEIRVLSYETIFDPVCKILPDSAKNDTSYVDIDLSKIKSKLRKTAEKIIKKERKKFRFDAFVTPADMFYWIREFIDVLKEQKIKVVVIDKEGMISPYFFNEFAKTIKEKCPFISDHLLVWSERQKEFWQACGVKKESITVIGQPRSDILFQKSRWKKRNELNEMLSDDRKVILFFSYDSWAYLPWEEYLSGKTSWRELLNSTFDALLDFARENSAVDIIIKMHPQQYGEDRKKIEQVCRESNLKNLYLMAGSATGYDLIINSDVIIGFQTTAIAEAMMTDKPVIYTFWTEHCKRWENGLIPYKDSNGLFVANSPDELKSLIKNSLKGYEIDQMTKENRKKLVSEFFFEVDGKCSERALQFLEKVIPGN